jgi:hypothetical protein
MFKSIRRMRCAQGIRSRIDDGRRSRILPNPIRTRMKHPSTLGTTFLALRTRMFALGAARRAHALAAPGGLCDRLT